MNEAKLSSKRERLHTIALDGHGTKIRLYQRSFGGGEEQTR